MKKDCRTLLVRQFFAFARELRITGGGRHFPVAPAPGVMKAGNELGGGQFPLPVFFFAHDARHAVPQAGQSGTITETGWTGFMQERGQDTSGLKLLQCAGGAECKKALQLLKLGRLPEDFIEGMACPGGCVGGPSKHRTETEIKRAREHLLKRADGRKVLENLRAYPMGSFSMHRNGESTPDIRDAHED